MPSTLPHNLAATTGVDEGYEIFAEGVTPPAFCTVLSTPKISIDLSDICATTWGKPTISGTPPWTSAAGCQPAVGATSGTDGLASATYRLTVGRISAVGSGAAADPNISGYCTAAESSGSSSPGPNSDSGSSSSSKSLIKVSPPSVVVTPADVAKTVINPGTSQQGDGIIDAPLTTFVVGVDRYWIHSDYLQHFKFSGTLDRPLQRRLWGKTSTQLFSNPTNAGGNWWIVNTYQDPAGLLLFVHVESVGATAATTGKGRIALAWSTNYAENCTYLGNVIAPYTDPNTDYNLEGVPYLVKDGYFYIYFKDLCGNAVARASVADVINAARSGTVTAWKKYYNGNWDSEGLGGNCSPITIEDGISHTDAAYSTYTGKYYMLMSRGNTNGEDTWIRMSESTDGIHWTAVKTIVDQHASAVTQGYQYVSIVDASGGIKNGTVGQKFYIYSAKDPYIPATVSVERWLVDLGGSSPD
jgi:hypothetical protein